MGRHSSDDSFGQSSKSRKSGGSRRRSRSKEKKIRSRYEDDSRDRRRSGHSGGSKSKRRRSSSSSSSSSSSDGRSDRRHGAKSSRDRSSKRSHGRYGSSGQKSRRERRSRSSSSSSSSSSDSQDSRYAKKKTQQMKSTDVKKPASNLLSRIEEKLDIMGQMNRYNAIDEIESVGFVQKTFKSSKPTRLEDIPIPSLDFKPVNLASLKSEILCHPNLILSQKERDEQWIRKLYNLKQKLLNETQTVSKF